MWIVRLLVIVAVVVAVWYVVRTVRSGGLPALGGSVRFTPVDELASGPRQAIDVRLAKDDLDGAVDAYRRATGAGAKESRTAVETYRWKTGGPRP